MQCVLQTRQVTFAVATTVVQSMWEVPGIAQFCSLFRSVFGHTKRGDAFQILDPEIDVSLCSASSSSSHRLVHPCLLWVSAVQVCRCAAVAGSADLLLALDRHSTPCDAACHLLRRSCAVLLCVH